MYMPGHDWRFSLLGSSGFRAPNVDDMGKVFEVSDGVIVVPNTDMRPETTTNFEVAISKTVEKTTTFDVNAFYTLYNNALSIDAFQVDGQSTVLIDTVPYLVTALTNKREAYLYGASAQMTDHISDRVTLRGSVTCTHGRIRTDSTDAPLDHIPPVYGRAGLEYQAKKFRMEGYVVFNSWKRLRDINTAPGSEDNLSYATPDGVPAWYTLNVRGSYSFTKNIAVQVGLENIADDFYRVYASGTSAPGRNLTVSLRANF
jgi:hemoglobin/transferrin/lactoferrin receptor protein